MENDKKRNYGPEGSNPEENSEQNMASRMKRELSASNPNDEFIDTDPNRYHVSEQNMGEENMLRNQSDERNTNAKDTNGGDVGTSINSGP